MNPGLQFALAVLQLGDRYVLQLRDDLPGVAARGMWGLFGGRIEAGEDPQDALVREIQEELCIELYSYRHWRTVDAQNEFHGCRVRYWIFESDIGSLWGTHDLREGQSVKDFQFSELKGLRIPRLIRKLLRDYNRDRNDRKQPQ